MKNFGDLQKMAQRMQADMAKAQEDLAALTVEGTAGGGAVVVVMSGTQECKQVRIKKDAVDPEDVETLEDLVRAATTDARGTSRRAVSGRVCGVPARETDPSDWRVASGGGAEAFSFGVTRSRIASSSGRGVPSLVRRCCSVSTSRFAIRAS